MGIFVLLFVFAVVTPCAGAELTEDSLVTENSLIADSNRFKRAVPTCKDGYEKVEPTSTMCLEDSNLFVKGGVSEEDKANIIKIHNEYRAEVTEPTATSMMKVYWDDELAAIAQKWAAQCLTGHEKDYGKSSMIPKYFIKPGQNAGYGKANWAANVKYWHDENEKYVYGQEGQQPGTGHYIQIIKDTAILVGCGYAECETAYKKHYICNYLTGVLSGKPPYIGGDSCDGCQDKCSDEKLCDCGDKFCFNYATMDINTCTCQCKQHWSGDKCLTLNCEILDPSYCAGTDEYCTGADNWPSTCPHLCGFC